MARERYVLLGVATPRTAWFREVGQWATSASIPAEFIKCVSLAELQARLASGRTFSAALVDGQIGGVDRDVVGLSQERGCPIVVVDPRGADAWRHMAPAAVLTPPFDREQLLEVLAAHATMIGITLDQAPTEEGEHPGLAGQLVSVIGPGGTGTSTAAIALAQGLGQGAGRHAASGSVLLADLCRAADQALLHDARVVVPGVQELLEAHRSGVLAPDAVLDLTFDVPERGYRLLLGLRRPRHWVAVRPRSLVATLDALQRTFDVTVCDIEPDLEGEAETGSIDVEERHLLARSALARSSVVFVVGGSGMKGLFSVVRLIGELLAMGLSGERLVPVISRGPRSPRQRAELVVALRDLLAANVGEAASQLLNPTHLPERRVDDALRDGVPLPKPLPMLLASAYHAVLARVGALGAAEAMDPQRVQPGSLARFAMEEGTIE